MEAGKLLNTWLGLAALGVVLFYIFNDPSKSTTLIHGAAGVGAGFVDTLQARPYSGPSA